MVVAIAIPAEDDDGVGARLRRGFAAVKRASDGMCRITTIIEHQVWVASRPAEPALDFRKLLLQNRAHNAFRGLPVGVGRGGGDVGFALQALSQFGIASAHMTAQCVSAGSFIL